MTAPEGSVTTPEMLPVPADACPNIARLIAASKPTPNRNLRTDKFFPIEKPLLPVAETSRSPAFDVKDGENFPVSQVNLSKPDECTAISRNGGRNGENRLMIRRDALTRVRI